jgi:hypothetical protein
LGIVGNYRNLQSKLPKLKVVGSRPITRSTLSRKALDNDANYLSDILIIMYFTR